MPCLLPLPGNILETTLPAGQVCRAVLVGLDLRVISPALFAMMVVMALATTMLTAPAVRLLKPETDPAEGDDGK